MIRVQRLKDAQNKLKEFEQVIIEAQDIWDMSRAALQANRAMNNFEAPDPIDEIRQRTALDSVTSSLNQVMAELETSLALDYNSIEATVVQPKALSNNASPTVAAVEVKLPWYLTGEVPIDTKGN